MKVAVIGSRSLVVNDLGKFLPEGTRELVSGGAAGIDSCAKKYAEAHGLRLTEFIPEYGSFGKSAPLRRNMQIILHADIVLAFWDKKSRGTMHVINNCKDLDIPVTVFVPDGAGSFTQM